MIKVLSKMYFLPKMEIYHVDSGTEEEISSVGKSDLEVGNCVEPPF